jgi:Zn-dependent peptidase ImmA (M78 family)
MPENPTNDSHINHMISVQSNIFAAELMTPRHLIRQEVSKVDVSKDIVSQLADTFWVSKQFMNHRLMDILIRET